jgi:hypothetical protein
MIASFTTIIDKHFTNVQSKTAFQLIIKCLSILHLMKRNGSIMQCFLTLTDELVVGQEKVLLSCLK